MSLQEQLQQVLAEIGQAEQSGRINTKEWDELHEKKSDILVELKPSTKEKIVYFNKSDLIGLQSGFVSEKAEPNFPMHIRQRSYLEYHSQQRHPIPYALIRYEERYFWIIREGGSGELRLIGKMGLPGGHVGEEDVVVGDVAQTMRNGLLRELKEEAGITPSIISSIRYVGYICSDIGVDADHLGMIYVVDITTDNIKAEEAGVLRGVWLKKEDVPFEKLESWSQMLYRNVLNIL